MADFDSGRLSVALADVAGGRENDFHAFAREFGFVCPAWRIACAQGRLLRDGAEYESTGQRFSATPM